LEQNNFDAVFEAQSIIEKTDLERDIVELKDKNGLSPLEIAILLVLKEHPEGLSEEVLSILVSERAKGLVQAKSYNFNFK
jgi:hypothetical protein